MINKITNNALHQEDNDNDEVWKVAYGLVFNEYLSTKINALLVELNVNLDYYDPDSSYKEDVLAYVRAIEDKVEIINKLVEF